MLLSFVLVGFVLNGSVFNLSSALPVLDGDGKVHSSNHCCPSGTVWNESLSKCVVVGGDGKRAVLSNCSAVCSDPDGCYCPFSCVKSATSREGNCGGCSPGEVWNSTSSKCEFPASSRIKWLSESVFSSDRIRVTSVSSLNSTHFVVAYRNYSAYYTNGVARVGHFVGSSIVWDTPEIVFNPECVGDISVSRLDSSHFVVTYSAYINNDGHEQDYVRVRIGHFNGSSIVWDTDPSSSLFDYRTSGVSVSSLNSTYFVVAYSSDKKGIVRVGHFDGSSVIWDTPAQENLDSGIIGENSVSRLDSSHFVVAYNDNFTGDYKMRLGYFDKDSHSIVWDAKDIIIAGEMAWPVSVSSLDSSHFVVAYQNDYAHYVNGEVRVGHFVGSSIVWDTPKIVFAYEGAEYISVSRLDSSHFVVAYLDYDYDYGTAREGYFNGSSIVLGAESVFNQMGTRDISVSSLNSTHFVIAYQDKVHANKGVVVIGAVPALSCPSGTVWNSTSGECDSSDGNGGNNDNGGYVGLSEVS